MSSVNNMPALFLAHGSPLNAIQDNAFTQDLRILNVDLPEPDVILSISAHWLTSGTYVCSSDQPEQIYDFFGFPPELYEIKYRPPGSLELANLISSNIKSAQVGQDFNWGIDHGSWTVLKHIYPEADIPVVQLSIDINATPDFHYHLGKELKFLRQKGALILGSGNIVHNLSIISMDQNALAFDWAIEFDELVKTKLQSDDHEALINYQKWGNLSKKAIPTNDHYLPMLYILGLMEEYENVRFVHESMQHGSISMRCFVIE